MRTAGTQYNLNQKALEIYLMGCKAPHCPGCHNEGLWDFERGVDIFGPITNSITIKAQSEMVEHLWIMGGEPLDQDIDELCEFLGMLKWYVGKPIWLWTRYDNIPKSLMDIVTFVKTGKYVEDKPSYVDERFGISLGSSNQRIIQINTQ
ncbi:MAG: 4Fe-4S cluster-binding domain-containing protein [Desulfobulbaceae bacterium]|nr:4Fe-4S cluster-binding domain-containing protein [Desulfobulbaceae bacterium]